MVHPPGNEAQQVVVAAADQVAFQYLVHFAQRGFEAGEVFAAVVREGDFGEHREGVSELLQAQVGAVAGDVACLFQPLDADQAGAGREAHCVREVHVGHAPVLLQLRQDAQVQSVDFEGFVHGGLASRMTGGQCARCGRVLRGFLSGREGFPHVGPFQHLVERLAQALEQEGEFRFAEDQGGGEAEDVVAEGAEHETVAVAGGEDAVGEAQGGVEAALGGLVADQFQRAEQAAVACVAHQGVAAQHVQAGREVRGAALAVGQDAAFLVEPQHFQGDGRAHGVGGVGGAVADGGAPGRAVRDAGIDRVAQQGGTHGRVAGGQALGHGHDVGLHAFSIAGEHGAGAAEARDHLVHDEENVQFAGGFAHGLEPASGRHDHAARALDGFAEEGRDVVRTQFGHLGPQVRDRGGDECLRIGARGMAVGVGGGDVVLRGQGQVEAPVEGRQRREAGAGGGRAVVAALQRDEVLLGGPPRVVVVLHDEAHRGVHRVRAPQRQVHVVERSRRDLHQLLGEADGRLAAEVEVARGVRQAPHLFGRRLHHAFLPVADVHAPQPGEGVQQFMPPCIRQPGAAAGRQHGRTAFLVRAPRRHGMDQVGPVDGVERGERGKIGDLVHGVGAPPEAEWNGQGCRCRTA